MRSLLSSLPIRTHMLLMVALMAVVPLGTIVYTGIEQRRNDLRTAREDVARLAYHIQSEQDGLLAGAEQLLGILSDFPAVQRHDAAAVNALLKGIVAKNLHYTNLIMIDKSGRLWAASTPPRRHISYADRRYFRNVLSSGRFSSGEYTIGRLLPEPVFAFGAPIRNRSGTVTGVAAVVFSLDKYRLLLKNVRFPEGSSIMLLDHRGTILYAAHDPGLVGKQDKAEIFGHMVAGPDEGTFEGTGNSTTRRIIAYRKLRLPGEQAPYMYVRTSIPLNAVLQSSNRTLLLHLTILSLLLLFSVGFALLISKRCVVDKIIALRNAARRLAHGNLDVKVAGSVSGGELGELGRAFDDMADSLSRDNAERKRAEAALHEQARLLGEEVEERQKAEEALRKTERFLRTIIDTEPECVKLLAPDGTVLLMNRAGLAMIGAASLDQVKGKSIYPLVAAAYRDAFIAITEAAFRGTPGRLEFESEGLNGEHLWLDTHAVPFYNEEGVIVSLLGITRDITDRKRAETALAVKQHQLEALNALLEERIAATVGEIRQKDQMLIQQSRLASMGEMINNIAHQWRQPLNNVGLIVQNLSYSFASGQLTPEEMEEQVESAMDTIKFMSRTIDDFRNFFRQDKEKRYFPLNETLNSTLEFVSPGLKNNNITVDLDMRDDVVAFGYRNEYSQVLVNILNNARDVLIERNIADPCIRIRAFSEAGQVVVTIWDNGGGISDDVLPRIYDPYFSTKESGKGTGIGLYMSKAIIEQNMGGKLTARTVGGGAEFRIELPSG
ncbi:MAG TPA: cache domain-containing protein [Desulfuromonadaceae bacterium]